jgi:NADH:ubiquinone oxidoreductase subunit E
MSIGLPLWDPGRPGHELLEILKEEIRTKGEPDATRIREIAELTGTTAAKVRGAIGYYSELKPTNATVRVCIGESCRARGADSVISELEKSGETVGQLH